MIFVFSEPSPASPTISDSEIDIAFAARDVSWITIDAGAHSAWSPREWWRSRELLWFLVWRDIRVRYKQTALGIAWAVFQPLGVALAFTLFVGQPAGLSSEGTPYAVFALSGFVVWTFVANVLTGSCQSIIANAHLITKVYFPRVLIPLAVVGARLVDLVIAGVLLLAALLIYGTPPLEVPLIMVKLILPLLFLILLSLGGGLWLATLNVRRRDIGILLPHLLQVGLFVTPVFYSMRMLPSSLQSIIAWNPLTPLLATWRGALFGRPTDWPTYGVLAVFTMLLLGSGLAVFAHFEDDFADVV